MIKITITGEYIQLNQFLKYTDLISSGGQTKMFLEEHSVFLNDVEVFETRKKIYVGDFLQIDDVKYQISGS